MKSSIFFSLSGLIGLGLLCLLTSCQKDIAGPAFNPDIPVPEFPSASEGAFEDQVAISWVGPRELYYQVYRTDKADRIGEPISGWLQTDTYYDENVEAQQQYFYRIRAALESEGQEASDFSEVTMGFSRGRSNRDPVAKPSGVSASRGDYDNKVKVSWDDVSGLFYRVYRSTSSSDMGSPVSDWRDSGSFNDYEARAGLTYYYRVRAASSEQGTRRSDYSSYSKGWVADAEPQRPDNVDASDGDYDDKVKITWVADGGSHFKVYRSTSLGSNGTAISDWITTEYYNDYDAEPGKYYYYRVKAAASDSGDNASSFSYHDRGYRGENGTGSSGSGNFSDGQFSASLITETSESRYTGRKCTVEIKNGELTVYVKRTLFNGTYSPTPKEGDVGYISSQSWELEGQDQNSKTWKMKGSGLSSASVWLPVNVLGSRVNQLLDVAPGGTMTLTKEGNGYRLFLKGAISSPYNTGLEMTFTF